MSSASPFNKLASGLIRVEDTASRVEIALPGRLAPLLSVCIGVHPWLNQKSEVGGRRSEVGGRRSEVGGRRSEVGASWLRVFLVKNYSNVI